MVTPNVLTGLLSPGGFCRSSPQWRAGPWAHPPAFPPPAHSRPSSRHVDWLGASPPEGAGKACPRTPGLGPHASPACPPPPGSSGDVCPSDIRLLHPTPAPPFSRHAASGQDLPSQFPTGEPRPRLPVPGPSLVPTVLHYVELR